MFDESEDTGDDDRQNCTLNRPVNNSQQNNRSERTFISALRSALSGRSSNLSEQGSSDNITANTVEENNQNMSMNELIDQNASNNKTNNEHQQIYNFVMNQDCSSPSSDILNNSDMTSKCTAKRSEHFSKDTHSRYDKIISPVIDYNASHNDTLISSIRQNVNLFADDSNFSSSMSYNNDSCGNLHGNDSSFSEYMLSSSNTDLSGQYFNFPCKDQINFDSKRNSFTLDADTNTKNSSLPRLIVENDNANIEDRLFTRSPSPHCISYPRYRHMNNRHEGSVLLSNPSKKLMVSDFPYLLDQTSLNLSSSSSMSSICGAMPANMSSSFTDNFEKQCNNNCSDKLTIANIHSEDSASPTLKNPYDDTSGEMQTTAQIDDDRIKREFRSLSNMARQLANENKRLRSITAEMRLRQSSSSLRGRTSASSSEDESLVTTALLDTIRQLKRDKETLANQYEREEEYLTNDLMKKLSKLREEKDQLERTFEKQQENVVKKLLSKIGKLEMDVDLKQKALDRMRRERVDLENTLEQEQEALVNKLWRKMQKLENEKQHLQDRLHRREHYTYQRRNCFQVNLQPRFHSSISHNGDEQLEIQQALLAPCHFVQASTQTSIQNDNNSDANDDNHSVCNLKYQIEQLKIDLFNIKDEMKQYQINHRKQLNSIINQNYKWKHHIETSAQKRRLDDIAENIAYTDIIAKICENVNENVSNSSVNKQCDKNVILTTEDAICSTTYDMSSNNADDLKQPRMPINLTDSYLKNRGTSYFKISNNLNEHDLNSNSREMSDDNISIDSALLQRTTSQCSSLYDQHTDNRLTPLANNFLLLSTDNLNSNVDFLNNTRLSCETKLISNMDCKTNIAKLPDNFVEANENHNSRLLNIEKDETSYGQYVDCSDLSYLESDDSQN